MARRRSCSKSRASSTAARRRSSPELQIPRRRLERRLLVLEQQPLGLHRVRLEHERELPLRDRARRPRCGARRSMRTGANRNPTRSAPAMRVRPALRPGPPRTMRVLDGWSRRWSVTAHYQVDDGATKSVMVDACRRLVARRGRPDGHVAARWSRPRALVRRDERVRLPRVRLEHERELPLHDRVTLSDTAR